MHQNRGICEIGIHRSDGDGGGSGAAAAFRGNLGPKDKKGLRILPGYAPMRCWSDVRLSCSLEGTPHGEGRKRGFSGVGLLTALQTTSPVGLHWDSVLYTAPAARERMRVRQTVSL